MKIGYYLSLLFTLFPCFAYAADHNETQLSSLNLLWGLPFLGLLFSIALFPLFSPRLWHHHYGKIALIWTLLFLGAIWIYFGIEVTWQLTLHAVISEYLPFILLLLALFTVSGGTIIKCNFQGTPKNNVCLLAFGTFFASVMGTTGAAILMIRPIISANQNRKYRAHSIIFFIFLVANIGGGLTPIGDPPLFIGFLKGVSFFWTLQHMLLPVGLNALLLLSIFFLMDSYLYQQERKSANLSTNLSHQISLSDVEQPKIQIIGIKNVLLLFFIVAAVLLSGLWQSDYLIEIGSVTVTLPNLVRNMLLIVIILISLMITPKTIHHANEFSWEPIIEVAKLFLAIFITITPLLAILHAGENGSLAGVISLVTNADGEPNNMNYFWLSGLLSGFLDNAPTYLVFFNLAGDATTLTTQFSNTLLAISMGSVFMGALTYIGNAPNFMVKTIATQNQIKMPTFFGYMRWSISLLIPLFLIDSWLFLH